MQDNRVATRLDVPRNSTEERLADKLTVDPHPGSRNVGLHHDRAKSLRRFLQTIESVTARVRSCPS